VKRGRLLKIILNTSVLSCVLIILLLGNSRCTGGTGPGDGTLSGFLYLFLEYTEDSCVQKLSGDDGSLVFDIDLDAGWRMYDIAVNPDNGDFYVYYGMDVNRYSKDGELLEVFDEVTINTPWEKLECALTGDNRCLWIVDVDYNLRCFNAVTGEHLTDGPEGWDVQPAPGNTVWALSSVNDDIAIRQFKPDGTWAYPISEPGCTIRGFAINPSDYSVWVRYDNNTFVHYDSKGNLISSFVYDFPYSEDYGIRFCVNGNNNDLLVMFGKFYVFSSNGDLKYETTYAHYVECCYSPSFGYWFGLIGGEDWDIKLVKLSAEGGVLKWEMDPTGYYFEGMISAAK
jgi:hypothetical protein